MVGWAGSLARWLLVLPFPGRVVSVPAGSLFKSGCGIFWCFFAFRSFDVDMVKRMVGRAGR